jgi:hypothetical protein
MVQVSDVYVFDVGGVYEKSPESLSGLRNLCPAYYNRSLRGRPECPLSAFHGPSVRNAKRRKGSRAAASNSRPVRLRAHRPPPLEAITDRRRAAKLRLAWIAFRRSASCGASWLFFSAHHEVSRSRTVAAASSSPIVMALCRGRPFSERWSTRRRQRGHRPASDRRMSVPCRSSNGRRASSCRRSGIGRVVGVMVFRILI